MDKIRAQFLDRLRECELELNSSKIQNILESETDTAKKRKFIDDRTELSMLRVKLETVSLEKVAVQLKSFEDDLNEGINNLKKSIDSVNNTVDILTSLRNLTGIITRILIIV
jgi:DNA-binding transcriptional MerR regulator